MGMFRKSKIYVAGHTGLLGCALISVLKSKGYNNIVTRSPAQLDLTDKRKVEGFFKKEKPEYVFLAAGLTGGIIANISYPAAFLHNNIAIQDCLFDSANKFGVKHLIFYGSSCMYPKYCRQPIKEEYLLTGELEETSQPYAIAKIAGVQACKAYNTEYKENRFIALVPNSMYGPNDDFDLTNSHLLAALIRKFHEAKVNMEKRVILWGTGKPKREFIFSEDVAGASIFAMIHSRKLQNMHYNVGTAKELSVKELAIITAKIIGFKGQIIWDTNKPDGTVRKLLDSGKFFSLGWKPKITLEEGIARTYSWYVRNSI